MMSRVPGRPWPTGTTRPVVLLGWPGRYSISPQIHNAAFREQGLDLVYLVAPTPPEAIGAVVETLGTIGAVGANVTVPHKQAVVPLCDTLTPEAERIGAVNTLSWTADGLLGDNTDAVGLANALGADIAPAPGEHYLLFGAGGAARAAAVAVGRLGGKLTVVARRVSAAQQVAQLGARSGAGPVEVIAADEISTLVRATADARIVINATPLGMNGESLPAPLMALVPGQVAYDLIYDPPATPFLEAAHRRGVDNHHGLGMLVAQAAASYRRWTGQQAPAGVMSAAATAVLTERRGRH